MLPTRFLEICESVALGLVVSEQNSKEISPKVSCEWGCCRDYVPPSVYCCLSPRFLAQVVLWEHTGAISASWRLHRPDTGST